MDDNQVCTNSRYIQAPAISDKRPLPSADDTQGILSSCCGRSPLGSGHADFDNPHEQELAIDSTMVLIMHSLNARLTKVEAYMDHFRNRLNLLTSSPIDSTMHRPTISKPELDLTCLDLFSRSPEPTHAQLTVLTERFVEGHQGLKHRQVLSPVRKWFRKKREDVGLWLMTALKRQAPDRVRHRARLANEFQVSVVEIPKLIEAARLIPVRGRATPESEALVAFCRAKAVDQLLRQPFKLSRAPSLAHRKG